MRFRAVIVLVLISALFPVVGGAEAAGAVGTCFGGAPTMVIMVPSAGCGDMAMMVDVDGDGNMEAVVLNGFLKAFGPWFIVDLAG